MKRVVFAFALVPLGLVLASTSFASDPAVPVITSLSATGATRNLRFDQYPGAQAYTIFSATNPAGPYLPNTNFFQAPYITSYTTNIITNTPTLVTNFAYEWRLTNVTASAGFYRVGITPLSSNAVLAGHVLNRLAYGPTPDELERVNAIGPQAYINEQLAFDGIADTLDNNYVIQTTNSVPADATTNWTQINITGTMAASPLYLFTTAPGEIYVDDLDLRPSFYYQQIVTNVVNGTNVYVTNRVFSSVSTSNILANGAFETGLSPWLTAGGASGTFLDNTKAHSGTNSLHVVSTTGASSSGSSYVRQTFPTTYGTSNSWGMTVTNTYNTSDAATLSYWYLPGADSSKLRVQLGSSINSSPGGLPPTPTWVYATATGTANANSRIYIYLSGVGDAYVDDVKLVAGSVPEVGANLVANGNFESALAGTWTSSADFANSALSLTTAHSGGSSLHLVATSAGSGNNDSVQQTLSPALTNGGTYTVSYW
ncbi:MAG: hypothetical protein EPO07_00290, partial [Verrucomicrobia bacterium]